MLGCYMLWYRNIFSHVETNSMTWVQNMRGVWFAMLFFTTNTLVFFFNVVVVLYAFATTLYLPMQNYDIEV